MNCSIILVTSRRVTVEYLGDHGVNVLDMRSDRALQEAVRGLYFAIMATFDGTGAVKIVENSEGKLLALGIQQQVQTVVPMPTPASPAPTAPIPQLVPKPSGLEGLPGGPPLREPPRM